MLRSLFEIGSHNDTPCVQFHSQENNVNEHDIPILYIHGAVKEQNWHNQKVVPNKFSEG